MTGKTLFIGIFLTLAGVLLLAALGLWLAVKTNGPAVLNWIDRIAGGAGHNAPFLSETSEAIAFGPDQQQRLFVTRPVHRAAPKTRADAPPAKPWPVIIFIHGGSWSHGDPADYGFIGRNMAPLGHVVVKAGYRLGEGGKFPAMLEDGANVVAWVQANIADYGGDPSRIYLMGHSAGAYNAAMIALDQRWLRDAGVSAAAVRGVIGLAGPYDFLPLTSDSTKRSFGDQADLDQTQPVNFARSGAPPFLLLSGTADETVRPRNSEALKTALLAAGEAPQLHLYEGVTHARIIMDFAAPWNRSSDIITRSARFIEEQEKRANPASGSN